MNKSLVLCCYTCESQIRSQRYTWGGLYPKVSFKPYGGKRQGSEQNQFPKGTRIFILVHRTRGSMSFFDIFAQTFVISRKTVKSAKNTICDISAQKSRRYEFCDIFAHTLVISRNTIKSAKNTICDTCA